MTCKHSTLDARRAYVSYLQAVLDIDILACPAHKTSASGGGLRYYAARENAVVDGSSLVSHTHQTAMRAVTLYSGSDGDIR